jgi:hypothetical protein
MQGGDYSDRVFRDDGEEGAGGGFGGAASRMGLMEGRSRGLKRVLKKADLSP